MAEDRIVKFYARLDARTVKSCDDDKLCPGGRS